MRGNGKIEQEVVSIAGKYYWLKLKKDFFKRGDIGIIEKLPHGQELILFYLKLLLESLESEGQLWMREGVPHSAATLALLFNMKQNMAEKGLELFRRLKMVQLEEGVFTLPDLDEMVGCESLSAERTRKYRERMRASHCDTTVTNCDAAVTPCDNSVTQSKSIEKEIEKESDQEIELEYGKAKDGQAFPIVLLTPDQRQELEGIMGTVELFHYISKLEQFIAVRRAHVKDPYATLLKWYREDHAG